MKRRLVGIALLAAVLIAVGLGVLKPLYPKWHQNQLNAALVGAITSRNVDQVQPLLAEGAEVDTLTPGGHSGLMWAAMTGQKELARTLIGHGANVQFRGVVGTTPLYLATEYGYPRIVRMLLDKVADPNVKTDNGHTALDVAASVRRIRSRSSQPMRPPTVATIDEEIRLLQKAGAKSKG